MKGKTKLVLLKDLRPNPNRDFKIDPVDEEEVKILAKSIDQHGFWNGVVCRERSDGTMEIVSGHRRVAAAMEAHVEEAPLFVGDFDEVEMIHIYATENATQRGNTSTAVTGAVASAARYLIKAILKGDENLLANLPEGSSAYTLGSLRGNIMSDKGIGRDIIVRFLAGVPGMKESVIKEQMANLKDSGAYARIVKEVSEEIEKEQEQAEAELKAAEEKAAQAKMAEEKAKAEKVKVKAKVTAEKAKAVSEQGKKAAASANGKEPTFDYLGVSKHLKSDNQVNAFRRSVSKKGIRELLPVNNQARLAAALVELAEKEDSELSGAFIKENITRLVIETKYYARNATQEAVAELERHDVQVRFERYQDDFGRNVRGMSAAGVKLLDLMKENRDRSFAFSSGFKGSLSRVQEIITKLINKL